MSDKLEKCVCGNEANIYFGANGLVDKCMAKCSNKEPILCSCKTPTYSTQKEAAAAWNVMMQALKSGWSSEVPTAEGIYLYKAQNGNIMPFEVSRDGYLYYGNTEYSSRKWRGLWYRINYPAPPKD